MLCYLDVLAADRGVPVAITHPDTTVSLIAGLGDPQAARVWLLQALTTSETHYCPVVPTYCGAPNLTGNNRERPFSTPDNS